MNLSDKAQRAQSLLDDQVLNEVFDRVEKAAIESLLSLNDPALETERLNAINRVNAVRALRGELASIVNQAKEAYRPLRAIV